MTDVSRRNFVALAGTGIALGACVDGSAKPAKYTENDPAARFGFPPDYGDNPNVARNDNFKASYIGMIHIRRAAGWKLSVNHAAFAVDPNAGNDGRLDKAIKILKKKGTGNFGDLQNDAAHKPVPRDGNFDRVNFDKYLGFKSKNELFIFIEGDGVEVTQGALLSFTPLGSDLLERNKNYAYYNAIRVDPDILVEAGLTGRMIRVRNYMTTEGDKPVGENEVVKRERHSMNIHFTVPGSGGTPVPMIIDPDTGNGMGNNP